MGKERQYTYLRRSEKSPEHTNPGLCQYQKRRFQIMLKQSDNSRDNACKQSYAESHSAQIGYIHGARNGSRTGRFHERKRYTRSNLKFTMDNGKVDRISETDPYVLYRL